jgi:hypothetical protein
MTEKGVAPAPTGIHGEAKVALDSGNLLFRGKNYDGALKLYSRAADLAPAELAPLLGIMMVSDITNDSNLGKTTLARIRKLDPGYADSTAMMSHAKIMKAHPPLKTAGPPGT